MFLVVLDLTTFARKLPSRMVRHSLRGLTIALHADPQADIRAGMPPNFDGIRMRDFKTTVRSIGHLVGVQPRTPGIRVLPRLHRGIGWCAFHQHDHAVVAERRHRASDADGPDRRIGGPAVRCTGQPARPTLGDHRRQHHFGAVRRCLHEAHRRSSLCGVSCRRGGYRRNGFGALPSSARRSGRPLRDDRGTGDHRCGVDVRSRPGGDQLRAAGGNRLAVQRGYEGQLSSSRIALYGRDSAQGRIHDCRRRIGVGPI